MVGDGYVVGETGCRDSWPLTHWSGLEPRGCALGEYLHGGCLVVVVEQR